MARSIRVASFNASLNRNAEGELIEDLSTGDDAQAQNVAEIIQRENPDILLINEFDYDADGTAAALFQQNYLGVSQGGAAPVEYPFVYAVPSNTGVPSGLDLDGNGEVGGPNDAFGFGFFPGQFAFVLYSKYPIDEDGIRTFQEFAWADMPGNLLTTPTPDTDPEALADLLSAEAVDGWRLSSKNHVDVPVIVDGEVVHVLAAHPTPPVFDGAEDRNGKRNFDEIRFWADYVEGADYIYDDNGVTGGLAPGARFVIVGDYNSDPFDGDSRPGAAQLVLENDLILASTTDPDLTPAGQGGIDNGTGGANDAHTGNPTFDTADFGFNAADPSMDTAPGNLRVDFALPSQAGFAYLGGAVIWPGNDDPFAAVTSFPTSDHRAVVVDLAITTGDAVSVTDLDVIGSVEIESGAVFEGTTVGGLSGIAYDPTTGTYTAIADDRGAGDDGTPRTYEIAIDLSDGSLDAGDVAVTGTTALTVGSFTLDVLNPDPEGIAFGRNGQTYISSERDFAGNPAVYLFDEAGTLEGTLPVDAKFLPGLDGERGVRNNLGFESLTVTPDHGTLYTATESALVQDGAPASLDAGSPARIVAYDLETGLPEAEYLYTVDPIAAAPNPSDAFADSGLVELLALDDRGTLLALERSFSIGAPDRGYTGKLYLVETQGATNVIDQDAVDPETQFLVPASKELLLDLGDLGIVIDNIEGMTLGPILPDGRQSLIIVSDDNFSAFGPQATQFIALSLDLERTDAGVIEVVFGDAPQTFAGGDGEDTALIAAALAEVEIDPIAGGFRLTPDEGGAVDLLSIETLVFDDLALIADMTAEAATVARHFETAFDRAGSLEGTSFWALRAQNGSVEAVADAFVASGEFRERYDALGNADFVSALQSNVTDVAQPLFEDVIARLDSGAIDRSDALLEIADSTVAMDAFENETDDGVLVFGATFF